MTVRNISTLGAAEQSSTSPWSSPGEASTALCFDEQRPFAFHTALQFRPWWILDLHAIYVLDRIVLHNRRDGWQHRAYGVVVEVSHDAEEWTLIHQGFAAFGDQRSPGPLVLSLGACIPARYVRLSLPQNGILHLAQVEVYADMEESVITQFKFRNNLQALMTHISPTEENDLQPQYVGETAEPHTENYSLAGFKIAYAGRFGNYIQQVTHAAILAQRTNVDKVKLAEHSIINIDQETLCGGVTFLPAAAPLADGVWMRGAFFDPSPFAPLLGAYLVFGPSEEREHCQIAREIIRPSLLIPGLVGNDAKDSTEVAVHIRSGDIFSDGPVDSGYRQPPLSFYQMAITNLVDKQYVSKILLVYEDAANPVIQHLVDWLRLNLIDFRIQSGTLAEDAAALIDAAHLIVSFGTFGYAIARLSRHIESIHYFEPELGGSYRDMHHVEEVYAISDTRGDYIKPGIFPPHYVGAWSNSSKQRTLMIEYPKSSLAMIRLR